jgi:probable HAF family extracellular repeat protein
MPMKPFLFIVSVVVLALSHSSSASQKPDTTFTFSLFDIPGADQTWPGGINDEGDIAGNIIFNDGEENRGFLRHPDGTFVLFEMPGPYGHGAVTDLNNEGVMAGFYLDDPLGPLGSPSSGFVRLPDGSFSLFTYPGAYSTFPYGVNDKGQIAGTFQNDDGSYHGFVRHADLSFEVIEFPSGCCTQVTGINNRGEVIGTWNDGGNQRGFLRRRNGAFELIEFDPATFTDPRQINQRGDILVRTGYDSLLRYVNGAWANLNHPTGCLSCLDLTGMNRHREIVGSYQFSGRTHGFIAQAETGVQ